MGYSEVQILESLMHDNRVPFFHVFIIPRLKCMCPIFSFSVPKKSESADIEEPKLETEGVIEEELNVHISPTPTDRKSPTSKTSKVLVFENIFHS